MTPFSVRKRIIEISKKISQMIIDGKRNFISKSRKFPSVKVNVEEVKAGEDFTYAEVSEDGNLTIYYPIDICDEDLASYKERLPYIISHELTHLFQFNYSDYFDEDEKESNSYYEYLTQDYEMDAEITLLLHIMEHCGTLEEAIKEYIWNFFSLQNYQEKDKSLEKIYENLEKNFGKEDYFEENLKYFVVFLQFLSSSEFLSKLKNHKILCKKH